jgi:hypothetical protein
VTTWSTFTVARDLPLAAGAVSAEARASAIVAVAPSRGDAPGNTGSGSVAVPSEEEARLRREICREYPAVCECAPIDPQVSWICVRVSNRRGAPHVTSPTEESQRKRLSPPAAPTPILCFIFWFGRFSCV